MKKKLLTILSVCCLACATVAVGCAKPAAITASETNVALWESESTEISVTTENYEEGKAITWASSDKKIATVAAKKGDAKTAVITAKAAGTVTITATLEDGETKVEVTVQVSEPTTFDMADLTIDEVENTDVDGNVIVVPEEIDADKISAIYIDGDKLNITAKDGDKNTVTVSDDSFEYGANTVMVKTDDNAYAVDLVYATMVLYTYDDFMAFLDYYPMNASTDYVALGANIDLKGYDMTNKTGYPSAAKWMGATFDGRGYAIIGAAYTHGFFTQHQGTIQNLALISPKKAVNGGGLIANENNGNNVNMFVYGTLIAASQGAASGADRAYIGNSVFIVNDASNTVDAAIMHNTADGQGGVIAGGVYENNFAITNRTKMYGNDNTDDMDKLYATLEAFKADTDKDLSAFEVGMWTIKDGVPMMKRATDILTFTHDADYVFDGVTVGANISEAVVSLKDEVAGVTYAGGVLSIADTVAVGTKITLKAETPEGLFKAEKTFTVRDKNFVDKTSVEVADVSIAASASVSVTLSDVDANLTANDVVAVSVAGTGVSYSIAEGKLTFSVGAVKARGDLSVLVLAKENVYKLSVYVADLIIMDVAGLEAYGAGFVSNYSKAGKLVALGADIDATDSAALISETAGVAMNYAYGNLMFDGRGYSIKNLKVRHGLIGASNVAGAGVRNLALINPSIVAGRTATSILLDGAPLCDGLIFENIYIENPSLGSAHNGIVARYIQKNCTMKNIVVKTNAALETDNYMTAGAYSNGGAVENVYGIGTQTKIFHASNPAGTAVTETNCKVYADVAALLADTAADGAKTTLNGLWKFENGKFYFGTTLIG